ncbi:MAG: methionine--tRNA ligase [bacterium]|nr:methionine--tRNA ligase [bacterium]
MLKRAYITTPIFYPNARPHLGHAYTATIADILARYRRAVGDEVYFLTGVDENTEKVARAARAAGQETGPYLDSVVSSFKDLFSEKKLNISYDQFIRTSDEKVHWPGAQALWQKLVEAGDIYHASYEGLYCVGHEAFITEKDLVDGKCPDHNEAPEHLKESNYFFRLSKYTSEIKKRIESNELEIIPAARKNEILALLEHGLQDVSFSRPADKVSVGVPVPGDTSQKMYVWCDALANYISALGYGRTDDTLFKKFWPSDVHIIGKDILRFHAGIWPGMLLSAGLPLPKKIFVHGFITSGGKKMSKTLGNVIDPDALIVEYGGEAVRYFLARHISPFEDGDITLESFKNAYNADLANGLGNLVSRVMKMAQEHHHPASVPMFEVGTPTESVGAEEGMLKDFNIQAYAEYVSGEITRFDKRIQETEPFKLVKKDKAAGQKIIAELVNGLSRIAELLQPILPATSAKIQDAITANKMPDQPLFPRK